MKNISVSAVAYVPSKHLRLLQIWNQLENLSDLYFQWKRKNRPQQAAHTKIDDDDDDDV